MTTGTSWLLDSKRIATKIKYAAESVDPNKIKWISNPTKACPRCNHLIDNSDVVHEWPGLPQGVKFDPTDQELLGHLLAKVGKRNTKRHPFINEFIPTVDEDDGICYTHPQKIPGVKMDGGVAHFFHRTYKAYNSGTRKRRKIQQNNDGGHTEGLGDVRWHKTGKTKPVIIDGVHLGCKKIMVLYCSMKKGEKPVKTNWVMHQYHLGTGEDEMDGEFVVSKIFYQQQHLLKSIDDNNTGVGHLSRPIENLGSEAVVASTSETAPDVAAPNEPEPRLAISPPDCVQDERHPQRSSEDKTATDNGIVTDESGDGTDILLERNTDQALENNVNPGDESKWWEGDSQFLLDSQQLAEGMALCEEFLQSQSSCGAEVEGTKRIKPCLLSEYAKKGGVDDFKKDLEECQTLTLNHNVSADRRQHATEFELLDNPLDMRLSQLEFGSQDSFLA